MCKLLVKFRKDLRLVHLDSATFKRLSLRLYLTRQEDGESKLDTKPVKHRDQQQSLDARLSLACDDNAVGTVTNQLVLLSVYKHVTTKYPLLVNHRN